MHITNYIRDHFQTHRQVLIDFNPLFGGMIEQLTEIERLTGFGDFVIQDIPPHAVRQFFAFSSTALVVFDDHGTLDSFFSPGACSPRTRNFLLNFSNFCRKTGGFYLLEGLIVQSRLLIWDVPIYDNRPLVDESFINRSLIGQALCLKYRLDFIFPVPKSEAQSNCYLLRPPDSTYSSRDVFLYDPKKKSTIFGLPF